MSLIVKAINLSIFSTTEDDSLIVRVAVENEGCSPLKQVRITVNSTSYTRRPNATFRMVGLAPGVLYPLRIETQAEGEEFVEYKATAFHVMPIQKGRLFHLSHIMVTVIYIHFCTPCIIAMMKKQNGRICIYVLT